MVDAAHNDSYHIFGPHNSSWIYGEHSLTLNQILTPPGRIIQVEGRGLHLNCRGEGTPLVILEAGFGGDGSSSWDPVLVDIASVTRVCAYDRAGILWSESSPKPRRAHQIVGELHALLAKAGEAPLYVLVGHSLGGPLVLVYADRYPDEVVGWSSSIHPTRSRWNGFHLRGSIC